MHGFVFVGKEVSLMAKGKYEYWLTPDGLLLLQAWARDGLTDEQIADKLGVVPSTLYEWKKRFSEISEALKGGKEIVDTEVENALLKRALGYSYNEDKYISMPMDEAEYYEKLDKYMNQYKYEHPEAADSDLMLVREQFPKNKMILAERKTKEVVPDTTAQIFWLKNRKPEQWRDKKDVDIKGDIKSNSPYNELTVEELKALARKCEDDEKT